MSTGAYDKDTRLVPVCRGIPMTVYSGGSVQGERWIEYECRHCNRSVSVVRTRDGGFRLDVRRSLRKWLEDTGDSARDLNKRVSEEMAWWLKRVREEDLPDCQEEDLVFVMEYDRRLMDAVIEKEAQS